LYHDWRGKSSLIGDVGKVFTCGRTIPISNDNGGPLGGSGNGLPRGGPLGGGCSDSLGGGGNDPLKGGDNNHLADQIPRSYVVGPTWLWIGPT